MITYEDLLAVGENEQDRMTFIQAAISKHKASAEYRYAQDAELYYNGENPTIMRYEKLIYDAAGRAHVDLWTANHKIASGFFPFVIDQEVSYLLGNGIRFADDGTKDKLGINFDEQMCDATESARVCGKVYCFWNFDHVEVFKLLEFVPLIGEENGALMAGIRFWQIDSTKPLRATLYELDGYTEYIKRNGEDMIVLQEKQKYVKTFKQSEADGTVIVDERNYDGFPIVPMYANKQKQSSLVGKRNTVDALDLASSNMVNNVDEGNLIYWVLTNCGGMNDLDDAEFVSRLKTLHVAHADGDAGSKAEAHSVEAPFEGTKVTIDMLINRLYDDFQAFNSAAVTASNQSATAIKASYVPLDLKADKIEREVTRCINGILAVAGIDDKPTYTRNQIINKTEETQRILQQAEWFDEEYIRKSLLTINGDIDQYEEIVQRMDAEDLNRLGGSGGNQGNEPEEDEE